MKQYNVEMKPGETLEHYYRRLAKVADQRLVRLEELEKVEGYEGAADWAYNKAAYNIATKWGTPHPNNPRFNTSPPANANQLKAKINDIKDFLQAPTSTKSGINEVYKKRAEEFNSNHGTNIKWQDWADYLDRYGKNLYDKYGSKVMNRVIKTVQSMANSDPEMSAQKLHHLALMRKDGGYKFNYVKVDGTDGGYDKLVDMAMHDIFRKRKDIEDIYKLLVSK